jgi:hypothetical protein
MRRGVIKKIRDKNVSCVDEEGNKLYALGNRQTSFPNQFWIFDFGFWIESAISGQI